MAQVSWLLSTHDLETLHRINALPDAAPEKLEEAGERFAYAYAIAEELEQGKYSLHR